MPTHRLQGGLRREGGLDTSQAVLAVSGGYVWALNPFWFSIDWFLILIGGYPMVGGGNTSLDQPRSSLLVYVHVLHISIINLLFYRAIALLSDSTPSKPYRTRHIYVSYKYWFIISPDLRKHQGTQIATVKCTNRASSLRLFVIDPKLNTIRADPFTFLLDTSTWYCYIELVRQ